jgi:hypothetical protein
MTHRMTPAALALVSLGSCGNGDSNESATTGGSGRGGSPSAAASGGFGTLASGGSGTVASGGFGTLASGGSGTVASGGFGTLASGGSGTVASGGQTGTCPYTVASFSCAAACANVQVLAVRCGSDPTLSPEARMTLAMYGLEGVCTYSCAVSSVTAQGQWQCLQGVPADAPCSAIGGCTVNNCP